MAIQTATMSEATPAGTTSVSVVIAELSWADLFAQLRRCPACGQRRDWDFSGRTDSTFAANHARKRAHLLTVLFTRNRVPSGMHGRNLRLTIKVDILSLSSAALAAISACLIIYDWLPMSATRNGSYLRVPSCPAVTIECRSRYRFKQSCAFPRTTQLVTACSPPAPVRTSMHNSLNISILKFNSLKRNPTSFIIRTC